MCVYCIFVHIFILIKKMKPSRLKVSIRRATARSVLPWRRLTSANQQFVELQDLGLESYTTYTLMMRATNHAGRRSDVISRNFTIETDTPQIMSE